jgi:hypothetical protein
LRRIFHHSDQRDLNEHIFDEHCLQYNDSDFHSSDIQPPEHKFRVQAWLDDLFCIVCSRYNGFIDGTLDRYDRTDR